EVPRRLVVLGGGIIGCEFASIFRRFGSEVSIVEMLPQLIPQEDADAAKELAKQFQRRGIELHLETTCDRVEDTGSALTVHFGGPRPIYTDPEIAGVGLTEQEAREQYGDDVEVGVFPWVANARAVMQNETVGWVKSIHESRYGELLGLIMVGPHVTDLIEAG